MRELCPAEMSKSVAHKDMNLPYTFTDPEQYHITLLPYPHVIISICDSP